MIQSINLIIEAKISWFKCDTREEHSIVDRRKKKKTLSVEAR